MMRCLVVDDEQLVRELLEDNIRQIPFLEFRGSCKNALQAMEWLQREPVDLLFLDIRMPGLSGLQLLETLPNPPSVILVTAYEQYALEGYNFDVVDYLLKPFSFERFLKACQKAADRHRLRQQNPEISPGRPTDFYVNVEYALVKVPVADITYVESLKDYIRIHFESGSPVMTRMTLKAIEEKLGSGRFTRVHKSYLVNLDKVTAIRRDLVCIGKIELPISEHFRENLERRIQR